jgi:hypothetical protein
VDNDQATFDRLFYTVNLISIVFHSLFRTIIHNVSMTIGRLYAADNFNPFLFFLSLFHAAKKEQTAVHLVDNSIFFLNN